MGEKRVRGLELLLAVNRSVAEVDRSPATLQTHEHDEVGECRFCGETCVGFDDAGITVNPTAGLTTTEAGGTATFTVVLNTQPSADV